jgi:hypothetical protein
LALATALALGASPASAQFTRDKSAQKKIDATIAEHYLKMNYGQAEEDLLGVVRACEDKCRSATLAKAWMYVGVVRGSGMEDQAGAREAFETALGQDPSVTLDDALATPQTTNTFLAARKSKRPEGGKKSIPMIGASPMTGASAPEETPAEEADAPKKSRAPLSCTPSVREAQTRRPIPFDCRADAEVVRMSLRYQEHGEASWKTIDMRRTGDSFRAQLPCEATMDSGNINLFIVATDEMGDPVDTLGSKGEPLRFAINPQSNEVPAYPGEDPPARCEEKVICPPDFPGCEDTMSADTGTDDSEDKAGLSGETQWLGLHFAADIGFIGGTNVCADGNADFDCFASGSESPYPGALPQGVAAVEDERGDAYPGTGIGSGASAGTMRVLLSYDRAFSEHVSAGARLGYAFGGGPATSSGQSFLPVHAEGRINYWLRGTNASGLRPYVHVGGGIAQVDIKKGDVTVRDCSEEAGRAAFLDCIEAVNAYDSANQPELPSKTLDAYRKLGNGFATAGGGVLLPLGGNASVQLNVNAMLMLPSSGFVVQPSLGLVYGL